MKFAFSSFANQNHIMKQILLFAILFIGIAITKSLQAQRSGFGFHMTANEYIGDLNGNSYNLYKFKNFKAGGAISLQQYLNPSFNLVEWGGYNRVQHYRSVADVAGNPFPFNSVDADFFNFNVLLKYKFNNGYLFSENTAFAPFLIGGLGVTHIKSNVYIGPQNSGRTKLDGQTKPSLIGGAGLFFRFNDIVGIEAASMFNRPFYDEWDGKKKGGNDIYLQHSLGLVFSIKKPADTDKDGVSDKKDNCPITPTGVTVDVNGCPVDTDGDGVADYMDKCPQETGLRNLAGCPDKDKDGIADKDDKCPTIPGLAKFDGCPDSDGDGVEDSKDKCPRTPGGADVDKKGCPLDSDGDKVPDYLDKCPNTKAGAAVDAAGCPTDDDGDGVLNAVDKCPNTPGPETNNGCPVVKEEAKKRLNFATRGIYFETGKSVLKPESYPKLDEIVSIINEYPDYNLRLGGHTDNVGKDAKNMILSQVRVDAVKTYLVNKGVPDNRLEATGYGKTKPIATNKTAIGRAQNRRVEMELFLK